jgi:microcystin-dependent protein
MSGTIPLSMTQQFDVYGKPLSGGQLFMIVAGTVATPQDAFQDAALTIRLPYPMTLDAAGRIPQFFLADGIVKIRLQDKNGVVQLSSDSVQVIGPSSGGGGGGGSVDPTQLIQTGNMIFRYGVGAFTGYVRLNGRSIGSATSGASERANADCQALFNFLWNTDPALPVNPGGRGATSAADWTANKGIALPDWRGFAVAGIDDMGAGASGRLTAAFFGSNATVLGAQGGVESHVITAAQSAAHTHSGTTSTESNTHTHAYNLPQAGAQKPNGTGTAPFDAMAAGGVTGPQTSNHTHNFITDSFGTNQPHNNVQPTKLATFYMKL